jgi:FAD/FMN-containing dehydrogenase/Fe-S oxidoreductase
MQDQAQTREIPYNYTSADDAQVVRTLLGQESWLVMEHLRGQRVTGRSAKLLLRVLGEFFVLKRNPFLLEDLLESPAKRRRFHAHVAHDLGIVHRNSRDNAQVMALVSACRSLLDGQMEELDRLPQRRSRLRQALGAVVGEEAVLFDPFTLVSHATDATDWRLHLPLAVATPQREEQVAPLLSAIASLGLKAIARGAGTGLTGGAVPLAPGCVVVNTERLNRILGLGEMQLGSGKLAYLDAEAGALTESAIKAAEARGLVFATDPTSAWACTLGGNIAENAGGKTAVLWGTAVDNLLSWRMALPGGRSVLVERLEHPGRKIRPDDELRFAVREGGALVKQVSLRGDQLRKRGLWKDITNKALGGLPGLQKEGTDGVITGARFILHRAYACKATLCLEFFGQDMEEASRVILALSQEFADRGQETLQALEHFDQEYVQAIGYQAKASRGGRPKAVLLIDLVAHNAAQLDRGKERMLSLLAPHANTEAFFAADAAKAEAFWADRKRLGAIARRTNAFKLNEDVVLPLHRLADFAAFVERLNQAEERHNQGQLALRLRQALELAAQADAALAARLEPALALFADFEAGAETAEGLKVRLAARFSGHQALLAAMERAWAEERGRLVVVATHMHAGDGNVHCNIPVFSNDHAMLRRAHGAADSLMRHAQALGGVVSGEHGIGITKLQYLDPARIAELDAHRAEYDPQGLMAPGSLRDPRIMEKVFTPSFNLLSLEARILAHDQLAVLAGKIQSCIRCGKCKPDCCVYIPGAGMFYHPRNKNLAIGSIIEAILYDAQRSQSTGFEALRRLEQVADHCTICHKCLKPCPVDIDTGEVSILERQILKARGFKHTALATRLSLAYLKKSRARRFQAAFRLGVLGLGSRAQRLASGMAQALPPRALRSSRALSMLARPLPLAKPGLLKDSLPACGARQALLFSPEGPAKRTAFYFPGCGSERLYGEVGQAALYVLLKAGVQVVLPPSGLCCGYPFAVNGRVEEAKGIELRDTIIFSQIREMFSYLKFDAVAFSCGTCFEAMRAMEAGKIFSAPLADAAALALETGLKHQPLGPALYHKPCHDSLQGKGLKAIEKAGGQPRDTAHCCGEAGTLALSRPDISTQLQDRKEESLREALKEAPERKTLLTNCPACLQGLGRQERLGVKVTHLAVALAEAAGGVAWKKDLVRMASKAELVTF